MSFSGFTPSDFKVFDIPGFKPRMEAIKSRIRPKLEAVGRELLPDVARIGGAPAFAHVAKHARRTVNPPDDTWVAFALDKRGYKKHCHFKVAVSRTGVRFLFEAGPEHAQKKRWLAAWKRHTPPARARAPPGQGARLVQERARRGARRPSSPTCPPTRWRASATSSCARATASSSSAGASPRRKPPGGSRASTRAPRARRFICSRPCIACGEDLQTFV